MFGRLARAAKVRIGHRTGIGVTVPVALRDALADPSQRQLCARHIADLAVDPRIIAEAETLLRRQQLYRFASSKLMAHRGSAAEKVCFYAASRTLARASDQRRRQLLLDLPSDKGPLDRFTLSRRDGALVIPALDWTVIKEAVAEAKEAFAEGSKSRAGTKKFMATAKLPGDPMASKIMALAKHPSVLRFVGKYLDGLPILYRINLIKSENIDIEDNSSQFHHLDPEGIRQVKIFLLVSDVDDDSGPLHLLKTDASDEVQVKLGYRQRRLPDTEVNAIVGTDRLVKCTGASGTLAIGDTSRCFHFGSRPGKSQRYIVMLQYLTPFCEEFPVDADKVGGKFAALAKDDDFDMRLLGASR